jgi:hypothetical protein
MIKSKRATLTNFTKIGEPNKCNTDYYARLRNPKCRGERETGEDNWGPSRPPPGPKKPPQIPSAPIINPYVPTVKIDQTPSSIIGRDNNALSTTGLVASGLVAGIGLGLAAYGLSAPLGALASSAENMASGYRALETTEGGEFGESFGASSSGEVAASAESAESALATSGDIEMTELGGGFFDADLAATETSALIPLELEGAELATAESTSLISTLASTTAGIGSAIAEGAVTVASTALTAATSAASATAAALSGVASVASATASSVLAGASAGLSSFAASIGLGSAVAPAGAFASLTEASAEAAAEGGAEAGLEAGAEAGVEAGVEVAGAAGAEAGLDVAAGSIAAGGGPLGWIIGGMLALGVGIYSAVTISNAVNQNNNAPLLITSSGTQDLDAPTINAIIAQINANPSGTNGQPSIAQQNILTKMNSALQYGHVEYVVTNAGNGTFVTQPNADGLVATMLALQQNPNLFNGIDPNVITAMGFNSKYSTQPYVSADGNQVFKDADTATAVLQPNLIQMGTNEFNYQKTTANGKSLYDAYTTQINNATDSTVKSYLEQQRAYATYPLGINPDGTVMTGADFSNKKEKWDNPTSQPAMPTATPAEQAAIQAAQSNLTIAQTALAVAHQNQTIADSTAATNASTLSATQALYSTDQATYSAAQTAYNAAQTAYNTAQTAAQIAAQTAYNDALATAAQNAIINAGVGSAIADVLIPNYDQNMNSASITNLANFENAGYITTDSLSGTVSVTPQFLNAYQTAIQTGATVILPTTNPVTGQHLSSIPGVLDLTTNNNSNNSNLNNSPTVINTPTGTGQVMVS